MFSSGHCVEYEQGSSSVEFGTEFDFVARMVESDHEMNDAVAAVLFVGYR